MKVIVSHTNLDFDGLASMIGAKKLYPQAEMILPEKLSPEVEHFLAIYKDIFPFMKKQFINWDHVKEIILVDANVISRTGKVKEKLIKFNEFIIYDHHPIVSESLPFNEGEISSIGATITLIIEQIQKKSISISPFEASVFALGIYSDTGAFTYEQTNARDLKAGAWCLENGANLSVIDQYRDIPFKNEQQSLLQILLQQMEIITEDGLEVVISFHEQKSYTSSLSSITKRLMHMTGSDAAFAIVGMGGKTFITARASSDRIDVLPVIDKLNGGGHPKAASAMRKGQPLLDIVNYIKNNVIKIIKPAITAQQLMSSPVRVVAPDTAIEEVSKMLYRYGHTGFPVVQNNLLIGIISRRDVDKALHHGLGHAPVKGYMSRNPITIKKADHLEIIQEVMIEEQVGRLPVMDKDELMGIVSRSDVIQAMHGRSKYTNSTASFSKLPYKKRINELMLQHLPEHVYKLLRLIGQESDRFQLQIYLIGGMVRDLLLERQNEDIDIVVEGDGIFFANQLKKSYGGHVREHEEFRTATWRHPSGLKIDVTSARTEYYDFPAALPKVEMSTIKEDLLRRDFTINAMGICLHKNEFGELIDYFHGYQDLLNKRLKVLYNLSFVEDPTRILRALRFESRFSFTMNQQTEELAKQSANNLLFVSKPRIANELKRLFIEESPIYAIKRMDSLGLLPFLFSNRATPETMYRRVEKLHKATSSLKENKIQLSSSIWISYLLSLTQLQESDGALNVEEVAQFCLKKEDHKILKDVQSLFYEDPLNGTLTSTLGDWHELFSSMKLEPLLTYFSLLGNKNGLHYLIARDHLWKNMKVTGENLIEAGLNPSPHFKDLLLKGEILQLTEPTLSRKEIVTILTSNEKI